MKIACLFSLAIAATAQDGAGSSQETSGYGEAAQSAQSYSAPEQAYSAPSYTAAAAPAYVAAPKCCVSACPEHSPFFSFTSCGCVAGIEYAAPAYEAHYAQPTYAAPAQESYGQQEESSGYRTLMVQPRNTIDTRLNVVSSTGRVSLWVGFAILFLSAWTFLNRGIAYYKLGAPNVLPVSRRFNSFLSAPLIAEGFVCLMASLAYLTMATGNGSYTRCCDGRQFLYARYIDWILTTPVMLHTILTFTGASDDDIVYIFFLDILMIVSGLIASLVCDGWKWFFFAFSMLVFLPVLSLLCSYRNEVVDMRFDYSFFFWNYATLANLTVLVWFLYPVVWIISEGTAVLSVDGEVIFYTVLDIIAKALLGFLVMNSKSIYTADTFVIADLKALLVARNFATKGD